MSEPAVENPYAGQGAVVLDIGDDVGALVVTMPADMEGVEVEIRPATSVVHAVPAPHSHDHAHDHGHGHTHEDGGHHPHVAVVLRPVGATRVPSLVYPELVEGRYELYVKGTTDVELVAEVTGGEVTTAAWPH